MVLFLAQICHTRFQLSNKSTIFTTLFALQESRHKNVGVMYSINDFFIEVFFSTVNRINYHSKTE
jgi:hypothetical protein